MTRKSRSLKLLALILMFVFFIVIIPVSAQNALVITYVNRISFDQFPNVESDVSVINQQGRLPITTLVQKDFTLSEDGKPITNFDVTPFQPNDQPLSILLAIDVSAGMAKTQYAFPLKDTIDAIKTVLPGLGSQELIGVITFGNNVSVVQDMTSDRDAVASVLDGLNATGYTALYDAVVKGSELLKNRTERRVLLVITDSFDYAASANNYADALVAAQNSNVPVVTVGFGANVDKNNLDKLSSLTGGFSVFNPDSTQLKPALNDILQAFRHQYRIRFVSQLSADSKEHDLAVGAIFQSVSSEGNAKFIAKSQDVKITIPDYAENQEAGGKLKFSPQTVPPVPPITNVELLVDGSSVANSQSAPFELDWDTSYLTPGIHEFIFRATDSATNTGQTQLHLNIRPPVIAGLANPTKDSKINGTITIEASIDSLSAIQKVDFYLDGQPLQTVNTPPFTIQWDSSKFPGDHVLTITATDENGFSATSDPMPIRVLLQNDIGLGFIITIVAVAALGIMIPISLRSRRKSRLVGSHASVSPGRTGANTAPVRAGSQAATPAVGLDLSPSTGAGGDQAVLVQTDPASSGTVWPLTGEEVRLGRKRDENDIALASVKASRRHAVIRKHAGQFVIYSLNPDNPVVLNGSAVQQHVLKPGDVLALGEQTFRFEMRG